ncbi:MAG: hypothetical protein LBG72_10020 [Spirochaetaceae bacterium]|jgi:hypothetical protein|nr:hypothetical protein [Spirochaetaceae bacterium]
MKAKFIYLAGLALLLGGGITGILAGCDLFEKKDTQESDGLGFTGEYTEDGRPLMMLSISASRQSVDGKSRALTTDIAAAYDFLEIVFHDSSKYYSASARMPDTLRVKVPPSATDYTGNVALFAGIYNGGAPVLLATSNTFDNIDDLGTVISGTTDKISDATKRIKFTVTALKTNINPTDASTNGSLEIDEDGAAAVETPRKAPDGTATFGTGFVPYWKISSDNSDYTLKLTIGDFVDSIVKWAGSANTPEHHYFTPVNTASDIGIRITIPGITALADSKFDGSTGIITIDGADSGWGTPAAPGGFTAYSFDIPVKALNAANTNGWYWHLRNGLSLAELDIGNNAVAAATSTGRSTGAAILLKIGTTSSDTIIVTNP